MSAFFHSPIVRGAISGWAAAAAVDFHAFRSWKSFHDLATYDWRTATFRWLQGFISGGAIAAGYGALLG